MRRPPVGLPGGWCGGCCSPCPAHIDAWQPDTHPSHRGIPLPSSGTLGPGLMTPSPTRRGNNVRKGRRGPTFIKHYSMLEVCLGNFPSLSHLILRASLIPLCVVEKMRLREASPGYLSLLCVLRHLQSQSREGISYTADSWFSASSPDLRLLKREDVWTFSCPYLP